MNRAEFMEELEQLLRCISEEEKNEALEYYESYFDDAGVEKEAEVIEELKSPKKVAESIKAGLRGEDRAIYTERGYEEEKQQNENHSISLNGQMASPGAVSLKKEDIEQKNFGQGEETQYNHNESGWQRDGNPYKTEEGRQKNYIIVIIAVLTLPIWGSVLLAVLSVLLGLLCGIIGLTVGIFALAVGLLVGGITAVLYGAVTLTGIVSLGLLEIGIGFICISVGGMLLGGALLLVTRAIPVFIKWLVKKTKKILHGKGDYVS